MKKQLTKQELKDRQEKKQRILKFVKRSMNIVCYCLSVLFLILCVAVGVQSCNSKNDKQNKSYREPYNDISLRANFANDNYIYSCLLNVGTQRISVDFQQNVIGSNLNLSAESTSQQSRRFFNYHFDDGVYIMANNGSYIEVEYFLLSFTSYITRYDDDSVDYYSYRMDKVWFRDYNGTDYSFLNYTGTTTLYNSNSYNVLNSMVNRIVSSSYDVTNNYFRSFYRLVDNPLSFMFSYDLNYYYMFNSYGYTDTYTNVNFESYDIVLDSDKFGRNLGYTLEIEMPFFISGNQLFNKIRLVYKRVASFVNPNYDNETWDTPWWTDSGSHQLLDNTNCGFFTNMTYVNTFTGQMVNVYKRDTANLVDNDLETKPVYWGYTNSCSWVADMYRHIIIFDDADSFNNSDAYVQLASLNYYNISTQNGVAIYSLFDMFSQAFRSITSLFSISIIPGFTIGVLMFMPFVVLIIVTIIRLVKK